MAIQSYMLGPGTFVLDALGDNKSIEAQLTNCVVKSAENAKTTDPIDVLSGEQLAGDVDLTHDYTVGGTVLQDIGAASFVEWSWANEGEWKTFKFIPSNAAGRKASGVCRIVGIDVGGDVKKRNTSDFTWVLQAKPVFAATP